jgi:hypothetical protein
MCKEEGVDKQLHFRSFVQTFRRRQLNPNNDVAVQYRIKSMKECVYKIFI